MSIRRMGLSLALSALLIGCAGLPDRGHQEVAATLKARGTDASQVGDAAAAKALLAELAGKPLGAADVVRIALVNNPGLRAQYAELGIAAAEVYDAGRLSNPTLSASVLFPHGSGEGNETTFGLAQAFTDLLLIGARTRFAEGEYERAKLLAVSSVLELAADAESGYYRLVSAQQVARMRQEIARAAGASADLAQRFFDAGNITRLELARERAAASQARLDHLESQNQVAAARADLAQVLGVRSADWRVLERLGLPTVGEDELASLMIRAEQSRLDLAASRKQVALFADALGVSRRFRFLGDVEIGVETVHSEGRRFTGPTLALQLPLFNQGKGAVARSRAQLEQADAELAALEVEIAAGIRRTHAELESARARVEHYRTALIPQREEIVARTQEQVNYMLVGQFELLLAKQEEYDAYQGYLEAVRDYWVARTELTRQVGAPLPSSAQIGTDTIDVDTLITPKEAPMGHGGSSDGMDHTGHDMKGKEAKPEQDHSRHGGQQAKPEADPHEGHKQAPKPVAEPPKPAPAETRPSHPGHDMPTGMEPHAPKPAPKDQADEPETEEHQHGDQP